MDTENAGIRLRAASVGNVWRVLVPGAGPGGYGIIQCGFLYGGAEDERVWHSHGAGSERSASAAAGLCFYGHERDRRACGRHGAEFRAEETPRALGSGQRAKGVSFFAKPSALFSGYGVVDSGRGSGSLGSGAASVVD